MKRLQPSGLGLLLAAVLTAAGTLVFATAEPRRMTVPNARHRAILYAPGVRAEASTRVVQFHGAALVVIGLGIAALSLYTPRR
jgi:hypothetical protein